MTPVIELLPLSVKLPRPSLFKVPLPATLLRPTPNPMLYRLVLTVTFPPRVAVKPALPFGLM